MSSLRKKLSINQAELAKRLGISRNYVSMIEGGREPSKQFISAFQMLEKQGDAAMGPAPEGHPAVKEDEPSRLMGTADLSRMLYELAEFAPRQCMEMCQRWISRYEYSRDPRYLAYSKKLLRLLQDIEQDDPAVLEDHLATESLS